MKYKLRGNNGVFIHDKHIDIDIDMDKVPFSINKDEELICIFRNNKLGIRADDVLRLCIIKADKENVKEYIKEIQIEIDKIKRKHIFYSEKIKKLSKGNGGKNGKSNN